MKPSGEHIHNKDNKKGKHTHDFEELGEEGIKLLIKGKLKNIPEVSFKKPKTEKQKKEAKEKREQTKQEKKDELNKLVEEIEKNFEKFQGTKQIAQQQTQQQIPIYIPQYTQPIGKNLNVENLTEINNMILEKENELKEYYETQFKQKWSEIEDNYKELEDRALQEDREKAFLINEQPVLPEIKPIPQPPSVIDDFELIQTPETPPIQTDFQQPDPNKQSLSDNVIDLLDIFDKEMLQKFKNTEKRNETLEIINTQQQELIDTKTNQLEQLNETINLMEQSVNLSKSDIDRLENELLNKFNEIKLLTDENEKLEKMKEAEILSIQLDGANNIAQLTEELGKVADERDNIQEELETLKLLNIEKPSPAEENIIEDNKSQAERLLLEVDDDNKRKREFLEKYISSNKIPKNKNRLDQLYLISNILIEAKGENFLKQNLDNILNKNPQITQKNLNIELYKIRQELESEEEQLQKQIINEMIEESNNEERLKILSDLESQRLEILTSIEQEKEKINEVEDDIEENEKNLRDFIREYETLILTIETEFENIGISDITEINKIEDEGDKEQLLSFFEYIDETKNKLEELINNIKNKLENGKILLDRKNIQMLEFKEDLTLINNKIEKLKKELL